jgi:hypothetical protein
MYTVAMLSAAVSFAGCTGSCQLIPAWYIGVLVVVGLRCVGLELELELGVVACQF